MVFHPGEETHARALFRGGKNAYGCCCRKINCVCTTHFDSLRKINLLFPMGVTYVRYIDTARLCSSSSVPRLPAQRSA